MANKETNTTEEANTNELIKFVNKNKDTLIGLADLLKPIKRKKDYLSDEEVDEDKNKSEENNIKQKKKPKLKNSEGYITLKKGNTIEKNSDENNLIQNLQELDIDDMSSNLENNKKEKTALIKKTKKKIIKINVKIIVKKLVHLMKNMKNIILFYILI